MAVMNRVFKERLQKLTRTLSNRRVPREGQHPTVAANTNQVAQVGQGEMETGSSISAANINRRSPSVASTIPDRDDNNDQSVVVEGEADDSEIDFGEPVLLRDIVPVEVRADVTGSPSGPEADANNDQSFVAQSEEDESEIDFGEPDVLRYVPPVEDRARVTGSPSGPEADAATQHAATLRDSDDQSVVVEGEEDESEIDFGEPYLLRDVAAVEVRAHTPSSPSGPEADAAAQHAATLRRYSELYQESFGDRDLDLEEDPEYNEREPRCNAENNDNNNNARPVLSAPVAHYLGPQPGAGLVLTPAAWSESDSGPEVDENLPPRTARETARRGIYSLPESVSPSQRNYITPQSEHRIRGRVVFGDLSVDSSDGGAEMRHEPLSDDEGFLADEEDGRLGTPEAPSEDESEGAHNDENNGVPRAFSEDEFFVQSGYADDDGEVRSQVSPTPAPQSPLRVRGRRVFGVISNGPAFPSSPEAEVATAPATPHTPIRIQGTPDFDWVMGASTPRGPHSVRPVREESAYPNEEPSPPTIRGRRVFGDLPVGPVEPSSPPRIRGRAVFGELPIEPAPKSEDEEEREGSGVSYASQHVEVKEEPTSDDDARALLKKEPTDDDKVILAGNEVVGEEEAEDASGPAQEAQEDQQPAPAPVPVAEEGAVADAPPAARRSLRVATRLAELAAPAPPAPAPAPVPVQPQRTKAARKTKKPARAAEAAMNNAEAGPSTAPAVEAATQVAPAKKAGGKKRKWDEVPSDAREEGPWAKRLRARESKSKA